MMYNHSTLEKVEIGVSNGAANSRCTSESVSGFFASHAPNTAARTEEAVMPRRCSIGTPTSFRAATFIGVKAGSNSTVTGAFTMSESSEKLIRRFLSKVDKTDSCWNWNAYTLPKMGYGMFWMNRTMRLSHRVSYEIFTGPISDGMQVCHSCDVPGCVNPDHLWLGSNSENVSDKVSKGRQSVMKGVLHPAARINEETVRWIRTCNLSGAEIGRRLGMDRSSINYIRSGKLWGHVV